MHGGRTRQVVSHSLEIIEFIQLLLCCSLPPVLNYSDCCQWNIQYTIPELYMNWFIMCGHCFVTDQHILLGADEGLYTLNLNEIHENSMELVRHCWPSLYY